MRFKVKRNSVSRLKCQLPPLSSLWLALKITDLPALIITWVKFLKIIFIYILCSNQSASYWLIHKCFSSFIKCVFDRKVGILVVPRGRCCSHHLDGDSPGLAQKEFNDSVSSVCRTWVLCIYSQTAEVWLPIALVWYWWVFGKFPSPITWNCWEDLIDWVVSAQ